MRLTALRLALLTVAASAPGLLSGCDDDGGVGTPPDLAGSWGAPDLARAVDLAAARDQGLHEGDAAAPDLGPRPHLDGLVTFTVLDNQTGVPAPARVLITAVPPTQPIRFDIDRVTGKSVNGEYGVGLAPGVIGAPEGVLLATGTGSIHLPLGTYSVFLTRGPEYEAEDNQITVDGIHDSTISATLVHSVDTTGWTGADLHVHTTRSFDSMLDLGARGQRGVGGRRADRLHGSQRPHRSPARPRGARLRRLRARHRRRRVQLYEGHGGAYPMPYDAKMPDDGGAMEYLLDWDSMKVRHGADAFNFMHSFSPRPAVTVNHPRLLPDLGYFINLTQFGPDGWAPPTPLPDAGTFDGLEVMNGYTDAPDELAVLLRDWFFLLSSGTRVSALGSSDTHRLRDVKAGFPRTWLRLPTDNVTRLLDTDLADAIRQQRAVASNGPFALLTVNGAQIGDLVGTQGATTVTVDATVDAPAWIDVDQVRVFVNGQPAKTFAVSQGTRPLFHQRFTLPVPAGDGWITLAASGSNPLPTGLIGDHELGMVLPFVVTNPVFLDADGDGSYPRRSPTPTPVRSRPSRSRWAPRTAATAAARITRVRRPSAAARTPLRKLRAAAVDQPRHVGEAVTRPRASPYAIVASTCPASTVAPSFTATCATVPSRGAFSSFSIFIASTTITPCPALTASPSATSTFTTLPGMGERTGCGPDFARAVTAPASAAARPSTSLSGTVCPPTVTTRSGAFPSTSTWATRPPSGEVSSHVADSTRRASTTRVRPPTVTR